MVRRHHYRARLWRSTLFLKLLSARLRNLRGGTGHDSSCSRCSGVFPMKLGSRGRVHASRILLLALLVPAGMPARLEAVDAYVVRFFTLPPNTCPTTGYRDQLAFRNTTGQDLVVRALSGSNGYSSPEDPLTIPAGRSKTVFIETLDRRGVLNHWTPRAPFVFMVNKLDVPAGVVIQSRGELWGQGLLISCSPFSSGDEIFGSFPLPVVYSLTPAGVSDYHLATDFGTVQSRTNVGVYNGSTVGGTARIEVREACDDQIIETRTVPVPAQTVIYAVGFKNTPLSPNCTEFDNTSDYSRYVVVTLDQPGFSFALTVAEVLPPVPLVSSSVAP
jgi:hypothetical protein